MASPRSWFEISLVGGIAALAGCADTGGQTLIVLHNTPPSDGCLITPSEAGSFVPIGRIDAIGTTVYGSSLGYIITPTIKNIADGADGTLVNERTVIFHGAHVDLTATNSVGDAVDLPAGAAQFTAPFSGSIGPDGGLAAVGFELVPAAVIAAIGGSLGSQETALINGSFTVFGETTAGIAVESDPYAYPVTVCNGCLLVDLGSCFGLPEATYSGGGECNTFQDSVAECCLTSNTPQQFLCPAVPETVPN